MINPINVLEQQKEVFYYYLDQYKKGKINNYNDEIIIKDLIENIMLSYRRLFVGNHKGSLSKFLRDKIGNNKYKLYIIKETELPESLKKGMIYNMPYMFNFSPPEVPTISNVFNEYKNITIKDYLEQKIFINIKIKENKYGLTIKEYIDIFLDKHITHIDLEPTDEHEKHLLLQRMSLGGYVLICPYILALELIFPLFIILDDIIKDLNPGTQHNLKHNLKML